VISKLITVILVTVLVVYLLRRMSGDRAASHTKPQPPAGKNKAAEDMVRCQVCGVNLPRSEAILSQGRFYCCDEHRKSGA
jgi:uncharacterized protein